MGFAHSLGFEGAVVLAALSLSLLSQWHEMAFRIGPAATTTKAVGPATWHGKTLCNVV